VGINQTETLLKKGEQTMKAMAEARRQLEKTQATYNTIVDGSNPKGDYLDDFSRVP
jgi:hypothetical protein